MIYSESEFRSIFISLDKDNSLLQEKCRVFRKHVDPSRWSLSKRFRRHIGDVWHMHRTKNNVWHYRRDHLYASLYLNDKWTRTPTTLVVFKAIALRLDDARANMLIADPYARYSARRGAIPYIPTRSTYRFPIFRLCTNTRAKPLSLSRRWRMSKKRCNPGVLNPCAAGCKSAVTTRANVNYPTSSRPVCGLYSN